MKEGFYIAEINFLLALPCHQCSKPFGVQIRTAASKVLFCVVLMNIYCVEQLKEMSWQRLAAQRKLLEYLPMSCSPFKFSIAFKISSISSQPACTLWQAMQPPLL